MRGVLRAAWLAIGLGILLEVLVLMLAAFTGTAGESGRPALADLAQKVSWSFLVCIGLAFGAAIKKVREIAMGGIGLFAAPAAFAAAKAIHKGLGQALGVVAPGSPLSIPLLIAVLKGIEYAVLGAALGRLTNRGRGLGSHAGAGLAVGLTFGLVLTWATGHLSATPSSPIGLAGNGINEVLFPVGCALVIYASEAA